MINMLVFDKKADDLERMVLTVRELLAYYSEDKWELESISRIEYYDYGDWSNRKIMEVVADMMRGGSYGDDNDGCICT